MIRKYFIKLEKSIEDKLHIVEDYILNKQTFSDEKGTIEGEVFFTDETTMSFVEVVNTRKKEKEKYSYHYMDKLKNLIFRYDNAKHHRDISTFPHHKHTAKGVEPCSEPNMQDVLVEIETEVIKNKE